MIMGDPGASDGVRTRDLQIHSLAPWTDSATLATRPDYPRMYQLVPQSVKRSREEAACPPRTLELRAAIRGVPCRGREVKQCVYLSP